MNYDEHAKAVTARLVEMITANETGEWVMPWHTHGLGDHLRARNATTGTAYTGANTITLAIDGIERGFPTGEWATYRQWQNGGAQVRKGERSAQIVKWIPTKATRDRHERLADPNGEPEENEQRLIPRVYAVFNAHQVDGLEHLTDAPEPDTTAGEWLERIGADVVYGGDRAYYMPSADRIYVPAIDQFDDPEAFYGTLIHEHIHWSGHPSRLNRDLQHPFGSPEYANEELVAELGSAIACAHLAIEPEPRADHAAYIAHWLNILNEDPKALFRSAAAAHRAINYLDNQEIRIAVPQ